MGRRFGLSVDTDLTKQRGTASGYWNQRRHISDPTNANLTKQKGIALFVVYVKNWLTKEHIMCPYTHIEFAGHKGITAVPVDTQRTNEYIVVVVIVVIIIIISSSSSGKSRPNVCGIEPRIAYRGSKWDGRRWALCWQGTCRCHVPTTRGFPAFQLSSGFYRRMYTRQISISGINYDMLGKECFRNEYNQM